MSPRHPTSPPSTTPTNPTPSITPTPTPTTSNMLNYLWIPLLISLSKHLPTSVNAKSTFNSTLLLTSSEFGQLSPGCPAPEPNLNYRPVIGILTHPGDGASGRLNNNSNASYIAASYVKFVEAAGARVIPLIYNEPKQNFDHKLNLINGVLFTGGWAKSGRYYEVAKYVFQKVLKKNDEGDHFPLVAICLGFELLTMIISQMMYVLVITCLFQNSLFYPYLTPCTTPPDEDMNILEQFSAADSASTLDFMQNINFQGTVFQRFPPDLLKKMSTDCLVMQNHNWGISPGKLQENSNLCGFFKILTTCSDDNDKVYVSTVQAHNYPVTAFQWHPEKNAFEWGLSMIPHSEDAVQVTQYVANFFVSEARKSLNRPPASEVLDNLIYNYSPTYCGKAGKGYDEVYIFT